MSILQQVFGLAVRPLVKGVCEAAGLTSANDLGDATVHVLKNHFVDHSYQVVNALQAANRKAWIALEVALAEETTLQGLTASADVRGFRDLVRDLPELKQQPQFRQKCLRELVRAREEGVLGGGSLTAEDLLREAGQQARFAGAGELREAESRHVTALAGELHDAGYPNLARLLQLSAGESSLLVVAVRFYFRREVEKNEELFRGLAFEKLDELGARLQGGLESIEQVLDRLADLHAEVRRSNETAEQNQKLLQQLVADVQKLMGRHGLSGRSLGHRSSTTTILDDRDRQAGRALLERYRQLPAEQRRAPEVLNAVGLVSLGIGQAENARKAFVAAAHNARDAPTRAAAHHNAYRAALEGGQHDEALQELLRAVELAPEQFAPFPVASYAPERILGSGGFGVTFLCRYQATGARVAVKALFTEDLERDPGKIFAEAGVLDQLNHPGIVRLRACDYVGTAPKRPYIVMEYFEGANLEELVQKHGALKLADFLEVATQAAEALQAAHEQGVLHRDVKPANLLLRQDGGRWQVRMIDFGLALKQNVLGSLARSSSQHRGIAGTIDYAAPEQMGRLPGVKVGPAADVYGFAKTCCYALFRKTEPTLHDWRTVPEPLAELLSTCLEREPGKRVGSFREVADRLKALRAPAGGESGRFRLEGERLQQAAAHADEKRQRREQKAQERPPADSFAVELAELLPEEPFKATCPSCEARLTVTDPGLVGKKIDCPKCKYRFVVDSPAAEAFPAERPRPAKSSRRTPERDENDDGEDEDRPNRLPLLIGGSVGGVAVLAALVLLFLGSGSLGEPEDQAVATPLVEPVAAVNPPPVAEGPPRGEVEPAPPPEAKEQALAGATRDLRGAAFSPDGKFVAAGGDDQTVRVWEVSSGRLVQTLPGQGAAVDCLQFVAGGKRLAVATQDGKLHFWDVETGVEGGRLGSKYGVAFAADGRLAVAGDQALTNGGFGGAFFPGGMAPGRFNPMGQGVGAAGQRAGLEVVSLELGKAVKRLQPLPDSVSHLAVTPHGSRAVVVGQFQNNEAHFLQVWDLAAGKEVRRFEGPPNGLHGLALAPDDRRAALIVYKDATHSGRQVQVWDLDLKKLAIAFDAPHDRAESVAFSPDGRFLLIGLDEGPGVAQMWEIDGAKPARGFSLPAPGNVAGVPLGFGPGMGMPGGGSSVVYPPAVAFAPDGRWVAAVGRDGVAQAWRVDDLGIRPLAAAAPVAAVPPAQNTPGPSEPAEVVGEVARFAGDDTGHVTAVTFAPDGKALVSGGQDRIVHLWDVKTGKETRFKGHEGTLAWVQFAADGKSILSSDVRGNQPLFGGRQRSGTVQWWDTGNPRQTVQFARQLGDVSVTACSADGARLLLAGAQTVEWWDTAPEKLVGQLAHQGKAQVVGMAPSADGRRALFALKLNGGLVDEIQYLDLLTKTDNRSVNDTKILQQWRVVDPTGVTAATPAGGARSLQLAGYANVTGNPGGLLMALAPRGQLAALAPPASDKVTVLDLASGKDLYTLQAHDGGVRCLAFSPDGRWLLTGGNDRKLRLWDVTTRKERHVFEGHDGPVTAVAFSTDGKFAASGSGAAGFLGGGPAGGYGREPGYPAGGIAMPGPGGGVTGTTGATGGVRVWALPAGQ